MSFAGRIFNRKQAREREIKDLYLRATTGTPVQAEAVADLTADITYTDVNYTASRNGNTITIEVEAAAANPTDTVLVDFTGTSDAIVITVTPNDGTNNGAVPVSVTTANLVEVINTGAITGKTATVTDDDSLRTLQTAAGGDTTALADGGEGDGVEATFADGDDGNPTVVSGLGTTSITRTGVGQFTVTLDSVWTSLKAARTVILNSTAVDLRAQLKSEAVSTSRTLVVMTLTGATPTEPAPGTTLMLKMTLKNADKW